MSEWDAFVDDWIDDWQLQDAKRSKVDMLEKYGLGYFRQHYLGVNSNLDDPVLNYQWYQVADDFIMKHKHVLIIVPPGWGKTYGLTITYPLMRMCRDRMTRGIIMSKAASRASDFSNPVRYHLESNLKMQADFGGPFKDDRHKDLKWNQEQIQIIGYDPMKHTPTLTTVGMMGQMEGLRPHWIILDDPIDRETAYSRLATDRFLEALDITIKRRLEPDKRNPDRKLIIITHRFSETDGLDRLMKMGVFKDSTLIIPALQGEGPEEQSLIPGIEPGKTTCPEGFPDKALQDEKDGMPKHIWLALYMARPMGRGDCPFDFDWINPELEENHNRWTDELPSYMDIWIDPAYKTEAKYDYTGIIGIGPHPKDDQGLILGALQAMRISSAFTEKYGDFFKNLPRRFNPKTIYVEINTAKTLGDEMRVAGLPVIDVHSSKGKEWRVGGLESLFKHGPGDKLRPDQHRLYFHNSLRTVYNSEDKKEGIMPAWDMFMDEYKFWSPSSNSHDHLLDGLGSYYYEKYIKNVPYSGDDYFVA